MELNTENIGRPLIGITMGDPASIGPEITIKALSHQSLYKICRPVVIGDMSILQQAVAVEGMPKVKFRLVSDPSEGRYEWGTIEVIDLGLMKEKLWKPGVFSASTGEASFRYVEKVIELAMAGQIDATVTNAISKEAVNLAGHHFSGHTEIYAYYTDTKKYTMMLALHDLRVVHVSTHVSLREACEKVKKDRVLEVIRIANKACKDMGIDIPKIGIAGLNPHCGEGGMFGREEMEEIAPAIEEAQKEGILAEGPLPPDSVFSKARGGWYDMVVAMYHDQGHIPLKVIGFVYSRERRKWDAVEGVNVTLGLPIIRTSVDHGTAFDQAGAATASELSLNYAIEYAVGFANSKNKTL